MKTSIKIATALLLAAGTLVNLNAQKDIGLQLWSVKEYMNKESAATIKAVGEMGYTFVEAAGYGDGKFYGMEPAKWKALLDKHGLQMLSSHTGPHTPEQADWDQTMAWWDEAIKAHLEAGAEFIVKPSMGPKGNSGSMEDLLSVCEYFDAIGEKCNAAGLRFGFHNHAVEFTEVDGKVRYDVLLENTDPKKVMYQLDLYWIQEGGKDALDYFKRYPKRFESWHIKDKAEVGASGTIDFEPIFKAKKKACMKHIIVEVEQYNFTTLESVQKSLEFLQEADYVK